MNWRRNLSVASLCFFTISFLGWAYETVMCYFARGRYCDRGFLSLPFCPIYGAPVCLFILFFGTPREGRLFRAIGQFPVKGELAEGWKRALSYVSYFFLSAAFATLFEYAIGAYFRGRGVKLWSYFSYPVNYKGLVCLPVSLLWGALFTLFAAFLWKPLYKTFARIPSLLALAANAVLWIGVSVDFFSKFFSL